jgi:filamentous hemagglutinin family protein
MSGVNFHPEIFMRAKQFAVAGLFVFGTLFNALANPTGMTVASGTATASQSGPQLTITTSQNAFLNWQTFNIAAGETTIFQQPSAQSVVWNRVNDPNPSQIFGNLQANGIVVLMNSSGFYFGPNSYVKTGGLIVSTANCIPPQNSGGSWEFNGPPPAASIINYGKINVVNGGPAFLIAQNVANFGDITAPGGTISIAAGQDVLVSERPDGRGLSMKVNLPAGAVDNEGRLVADAGTISVNAQTVNQNGIIQANSVRNENGVIELVASDKLNLGADSQISASGDASAGGSAGGSVTLKSGNTFSDATGSRIEVTGGSQDGNGGNVEISAPDVLSLNSIINARAQSGWMAGELLLDPGYIILDTSGSDSAGNGTVSAGTSSTTTLDLNVNTAFANLVVSDIILQAVNDITLTGGTTWDLSGTIGANLGGVTSGQLTLEAGNNIIFQDGSAIVDENNWSVALKAGVNNFTTGTIKTGTGNIYLDGGDGVGGSIQTTAGSINLSAGSGIQIGSGSVSSSGGNVTWQAGGDIQFGDGSQITDGNNGTVTLDAGYNFANNTIQFGTGNIYLNGGPNGDGVGGSIQTASDNINLEAGQDITVGSGYVITTGGGSISAHALAGNIDTGSDAQGYHFVNNARSVGAAYNLKNGLGGISTAAGGDVTLIAGGDVTSVLPGYKSYYYDNGISGSLGNLGNDYLTAGSGAYGPQPGNVTIVAGGNVTGNYLVANGYGAIYAGAQMDASGNPIVARDANNNLITEKDAIGNPVKDASGNDIYVYALNSASTGSAGTDLQYNGLALNLISGGWNVAAAQNIRLQEVRNPNGVFDGSGSYAHYFNYAADAYVDLSAGNQVQLGSSITLPRLSNGDATKDVNNVSVIYPSILNITAGDGGIILGTGTSSSSLTLFPSAQGSLTIDTPGNLVSAHNVSGTGIPLFNLIVSDADPTQPQYTLTHTFGAGDHAASPVHADVSTPIYLNIGGSMNYINLIVPEAAQLNVGGDMINCGFQGMNVSADPGFQVQISEADGSTRKVTVNPAVTSIKVTGDIFNRGDFTSVDLSGIVGAQGLDLSALAEALPGQLVDSTTLATSFFYDPTTHILTYENNPQHTLASVLNLLNGLAIQQVINGVPQWEDPPDDTIPVPETVSVLGDPTQPGTAASALLAQYKALSALPNPGKQQLGYALPKDAGSYGYIIGGGGQFDITARSIDLGTSAGIQSEGVALYTAGGSYQYAPYPLAGLFGNGGVFTRGTDIAITTTGNNSAGVNPATGDLIGDVDMFSSSIASFDGGNISISASGAVNAGSSVFTVNASGATGIYSTSGGDVSIVAGGDISVNGSRIATYDGGNITVESLNGSINAGKGASTPVPVTGYYEDPVTHAVYVESTQLPFSGITALTFPARPDDGSYPAPPALLGNILVEAPNGDIAANAAGILQIPLNGLNYPDATTTVLAGYELRDGAGNAVSAADLADGTPVLVSPNEDINASGSGIITGNANLDASGNINGLIFARDNININAQQNINVTAFGIGNVNVSSSGGTISGTIIGVGGVTASGSSVSASLISANVSGATSGQSGLGQGVAANATSQGLANNESTQAAAASDQGADDQKKKKGKQIALAQKVGRVTVILPPKKVSETKTSTPGT